MANSIKIGDTLINNVKKGTFQVDRIYLGINSIFTGIVPTVLFDDQFSGTIINTSTKWRLNNPNSSSILINQNNGLFLNALDVSSTTFGADNISGLTSWNTSTNSLFMTFDVIVPQQNINTWIFGFTNTAFDIGYANRFMFYRSSSAGKIGIAIVSGSTTVYSSEALSLSLSTVKRLGIKCTPAAITFYYWNGTSWISIGASSNPYGSMTFKPTFCAIDSTVLAGANNIKINRLYITDYFHTTEIP